MRMPWTSDVGWVMLESQALPLVPPRLLQAEQACVCQPRPMTKHTVKADRHAMLSSCCSRFCDASLASKECPALGRDTDPQWRYPSALHPFSTEEEEAERLYYAAISGLPKRAFTIQAKYLSRRSPIATSYLTWLILYRGQLWPVVGGAIVNAKST